MQIRRLCIVLSGVALFLVPTTAQGKAAATPLYYLASRAEAILRGTVVEISSSTFEFEVEESLRGAFHRGQKVRIAKFRDWTCGRRWTGYAKGQKLVIFLETVPEAQRNFISEQAGEVGKLPRGILQAMGSEGPAEMPISGNTVFVPSSTLYELANLDADTSATWQEQHLIDGQPLMSASVDWAIFKQRTLDFAQIRQETFTLLDALDASERERLLRAYGKITTASEELAQLARRDILSAAFVLGALNEWRYARRN